MAVVEDKDNGYAEVTRRLHELAAKGVSIDVGILAKDADRAELDEKGNEGPMTLLQIAIINHFGTENGHVPPRPFLSGWFDENEKRLHDELSTMMRSVVDGKRTVEQVLEILGQRWVGEIQARISRHGDGTYPENKRSTVKRKRSSTPLIRFGALRGGVSYRVNLDSGGGGTDESVGSSQSASSGREAWTVE